VTQIHFKAAVKLLSCWLTVCTRLWMLQFLCLTFFCNQRWSKTQKCPSVRHWLLWRSSLIGCGVNLICFLIRLLIHS